MAFLIKCICFTELQTSIHHYFVVQLLPIFVHSNLVSQECDEKGNQLELECLRMSPKHFYATMLFGFIKIFKLQSLNTLNLFLLLHIYFTELKALSMWDKVYPKLG